MERKTYFRIISTIIGIPSTIWMFFLLGWRVGLCLILVLWANNLEISAKSME